MGLYLLALFDRNQPLLSLLHTGGEIGQNHTRLNTDRLIRFRFLQVTVPVQIQCCELPSCLETAVCVNAHHGHTLSTY